MEGACVGAGKGSDSDRSTGRRFCRWTVKWSRSCRTRVGSARPRRGYGSTVRRDGRHAHRCRHPQRGDTAAGVVELNSRGLRNEHDISHREFKSAVVQRDHRCSIKHEKDLLMRNRVRCASTSPARDPSAKRTAVDCRERAPHRSGISRRAFGGCRDRRFVESACRSPFVSLTVFIGQVD